MAGENAHQPNDSSTSEADKKLDRLNGCRLRDQRFLKMKDKFEDGRLPTPPPDPQCPRIVRDRDIACHNGGPEEDEEDDLVAYLTDLGASPFDSRMFDYDTPNSATSAASVTDGPTGPFVEEAFEHLDRLCSLTEQILELRDRSSKFFRRVRDLERAKALRNADRRLEMALANNEEFINDFADEDTGFAESLLDAMLSNGRDIPMQRRYERTSVCSPSSRRRSRSLAAAEYTSGASSVVDRVDPRKRSSRNASRNGGPKVSKWTRVKAAFKWERACTNDLAEVVESIMTSPSTPPTRYLKIPDVIAGSWSGSALSPCTSEISSPSTPIGRVSSASSSNEEVFDDSQKNIIIINSDRHTVQTKDESKKEDADLPIQIAESIDISNEINRVKPLIRIISDADATMRFANGAEKDAEILSKKSTPTLTITIPSNEEDIRSLSSPESTSPLPSSAQDSGGSSPQRPKTRQDNLTPKEFKQQYLTIEEVITPAPKIQRQDSKWNKVRRAFLTNATFSVPPSPVRRVAPQSFAPGDTSHDRTETSKDYQALREKFGAEFHQKLIEWERLKGGTSRIATTRSTRDGLPLNEERLAPEFRRKLQEWKRAKKDRRRSGASIEQQRVGRRRLTDWQLWRSPSKAEGRNYGKNQNSIGSRGSCTSIGSAGSFGSDGKQRLCEDFVKRMETWRKTNEHPCRSNERSKNPSANRIASDVIDETEFLALEKLLLLFGQSARNEHQEDDAKRLNDCFDGDSRFIAASRGANCGNEVLIRTSVGSYRFEGISREFTRKLYDWEKYRGISPRSSTFRLLGPGYTFVQDSYETTLTNSQNVAGKNRAFHWSLKRSKSDGNIFEGGSHDESLALRRSASLQSLNHSRDKLCKDDNQMDILPASNKEIKDLSDDTAVEDSEPEAMIVDIEDVIEETASPLKRVQPHQTPVYSVAASETTSIAVPLGTVTSSHEPSPVFLVEAEDNDECERWNDRATWLHPEVCSSENSPSPEQSPFPGNWRERTASLREDQSKWERLKSWRRKSNDEDEEESAGWTGKGHSSISDSDSVKLDRSVMWNPDTWDESGEIEQYASEVNRDPIRIEFPVTLIYESDNSNSDAREQDFFKSDNAESAQFANNIGTSSTIEDVEDPMDSPCTCRKANEMQKCENLTSDANAERKNQMESLQDNERSRNPLTGEGSHIYQLTETLSLSNYRDSTKISSNLSNLNLDDNEDIPECRGSDNEDKSLTHYESCNLSEQQLQTDNDEHYEIVIFKTDACDATINNLSLYEPLNCYDNYNSSYDINNSEKENLSISGLSDGKESNDLDLRTNLLIDSTVPTTPVTVSRDNETRCLKRILINEKTLNEIVVSTASAEGGVKDTEENQDYSINMNYSDEATFANNRQRGNNYESTSVTRDRQATCTKKNGTSSGNVFVKTKRMIFAPFRRADERKGMFSRKESNGSVDGRILRSKSKSKSRSASPKLCRQDIMSRMSLSLPWPLRSLSRENDSTCEAESRRSENKAKDATTVPRDNSYCNEFPKVDEQRSANNDKLNILNNDKPSSTRVDRPRIHCTDTQNVSINTYSYGADSSRVTKQTEKSRATAIERDADICRMQNEVKRTQEDNEEEAKRIEANCAGKEDEGKRDPYEFDRRQDETRHEENHSKSDVVPADLIHKLRILSAAAARREGRAVATEAFVTSSLESRSSRIRRAKESFLSHRGGPFCRTVAGSMEIFHRDDPWRRKSTSQVSASGEVSRSNDATVTTLKPHGGIGIESQMKTHEEAATSNEHNTNAHRDDSAIDTGLRSDLIKSASVGMINVDPDTFGRLAAADRGCESLPRTITKRRDSSGPLAKIVSKLKLSRLIRTKNTDSGGMSTISTLCRHSLLIDTRCDRDERRGNEQEAENGIAEIAEDTSKDNDDSSDESSETIHE